MSESLPYSSVHIETPAEVARRLDLPDADFRIFTWRPSPTLNVFAYAATGERAKTKIIAHGVGATEAEAVAAMAPCVHPRAKAKPKSKSATT